MPELTDRGGSSGGRQGELPPMRDPKEQATLGNLVSALKIIACNLIWHFLSMLLVDPGCLLKLSASCSWFLCLITFAVCACFSCSL